MSEFWESIFKDKQEMWGWEPAESAIDAMERFQKSGFRSVLIPGFGYGRNAKPFIDNGFTVTGIEISATAIELAKKQFGEGLQIHLGSVGEMPFDQEMYDGIYCYSLLHLLDENERTKLIQDCYNQLKTNGHMVFVSISKLDFRYGQGTALSKDRFQTWPGVTLFFYDSESIQSEFGNYGLLEAEETDEPKENPGNKPRQKFWYIVCRKPA
jgi:SAM-dependent methyltransferase